MLLRRTQRKMGNPRPEVVLFVIMLILGIVSIKAGPLALIMRAMGSNTMVPGVVTLVMIRLITGVMRVMIRLITGS